MARADILPKMNVFLCEPLDKRTAGSNTEGYKGVFYRESGSKWFASEAGSASRSKSCNFI
jgi:hypothetical protein